MCLLIRQQNYENITVFLKFFFIQQKIFVYPAKTFTFALSNHKRKVMTTATATKRERRSFPNGNFNNAQMEVLKIFNNDFTDDQLSRLRMVLVKFLNEMVQEEITRKLSAGELSLESIQNPEMHYRSKTATV